jgi:insulysin
LDEPTFNQLRTIEQLGYIVSTSTVSTRDIIGTKFLVQSSVKGCDGLRASLEAHLSRMLAGLDEMTEDAFEEIRDSVLTIYEEKDKNLKEEFDRYWSNELITHKYQFNRQELECELLEELTQDEFIAHFKMMFGPCARRLDIFYHSASHKAGYPASSISEFK